MRHWLLTVWKASAMSGSVLERFQRGRGGQEAAEYDCTRYAGALAVQIEVRDAVLTQRDEWDAAEVSQRRVLEHHLGQLLRSIAFDVVPPDAVRHRHEDSAKMSAASRGGCGGVSWMGSYVHGQRNEQKASTDKGC